MGIGCRVFLIDDNDSLQRIPMTRLDQLLHFDRRESLQQYAGKRVRWRWQGRRYWPLGISITFYLPFDSKGRINKKEWEQGIRLGMELLPPLLNEQDPKKVINAQHRFAKRRYEHEFKWKPSRKVEEAVVKAVFESNRGL
jgi:hypothetical protein